MCCITKAVLRLSFTFNLSAVTGTIYSHCVVTRKRKRQGLGKCAIYGWYLLESQGIFILNVENKE